GFWLAELTLLETATPAPVRTSTLAQVTSLGIMLAVDRNEIVASVGTLRGNRPVPGATVSIYDVKGRRLGEVQATDEGYARLLRRDALRSRTDLFVVAETKDDRCFEVIEGWARPEATADSVPGTDGRSPRVRHIGGLWTERGVYRPGETAHAFA